MNCFSYDSFSFFQEQVLLIFYLPFWFHVKYSRMLKNSELYIRDHLSGTKVTIWIDSEYDAVFDFSCIASWPFIRYQGNNLDCFWIWCCFRFFLRCLVQPNQDIHCLLHVIFIIRIRLCIIQTVNLYFLCFWNIALLKFS